MKKYCFFVFPNIKNAFVRVFLELKKDSTSFGRREDCDVNLGKVETTLCSPTAYSGLHFIIRRVNVISFLKKYNSKLLQEFRDEFSI